MASNGSNRSTKTKKSFKQALAKSVSNLFHRMEPTDPRNPIEDVHRELIINDDSNPLKISSSTPSFSPRPESAIESDIKSLISETDKNSLPFIVQNDNSEYQIDGLALLDNRNSPKTEYVPLNSDDISETNQEYRSYKLSFKGYEHFDFVGKAERYGDFILSIKSNSSTHLSGILRTKDGNTIQNDISVKNISVQNILNKFNENMIVTEMKPVLHPAASDMIANYDKEIIKLKFTFGLIYQKFGQLNEKEMFDNQLNSAEFDEFLDFIGERIKLKNFSSFKGGLDVTSDDTGQESIYTKFQDAEIMFHVSTLLPHSARDSQQIERKRHIGNDRVTIVFQDELTPFCPFLIKSKLLHVFIIIQPIKINDQIDGYQVSVLSRKDVPYFEPFISKPYVYKKDESFRKFLLTKLINAEYASLKAPAFSQFSERTLSDQLTKLCDNLRDLTRQFSIYELNQPPLSESPKPILSLSDDNNNGNKKAADKLKTIVDKMKYKSIMRRGEKHDAEKKFETELSISQAKQNEIISINETDDQESKLSMSQDEEANNSNQDLSVVSTDVLRKKKLTSNLDATQSKSLDSINNNHTNTSKVEKKKTSKLSFIKRVESRFEQKSITPGNRILKEE